jgi:hypothetical protein
MRQGALVADEIKSQLLYHDPYFAICTPFASKLDEATFSKNVAPDSIQTTRLPANSQALLARKFVHFTWLKRLRFTRKRLRCGG